MQPRRLAQGLLLNKHTAKHSSYNTWMVCQLEMMKNIHPIYQLKLAKKLNFPSL